MKKDVKKSQGQTAAKAKSGTRSGSSKKSDTNNSNCSNETYQRVEIIPGCPAAILEDSEKGYTIVCGNQILTRKWYKTKEECMKRIEKTDWELIGAVLYILGEDIAMRTFAKMK